MGQRAPTSRWPRATARARTSCSRAPTTTTCTSSSSSCCSAGCPRASAGTGSTGTPGGRCSARRPWSTPRRTTPALTSYVPVVDSGGAGLHRGGTGVEKTYEFLSAGVFTINDDRAITNPWGVAGGRAGGRGAKRLVKRDGREFTLPSKVDNLAVQPGDRFVFRTAGAGGWGDPLERPADRVAADVRELTVSPEGARRDYGVVVDADGAVEESATAELRESLRSDRAARSPRSTSGTRRASRSASTRRRSPTSHGTITAAPCRRRAGSGCAGAPRAADRRRPRTAASRVRSGAARSARRRARSHRSAAAPGRSLRAPARRRRRRAGSRAET